jgi:predicted transcriptional regulator
MSKHPKGIVEQLRAAIRKAERAGISRYRLSKLSGVEQAVLCRIMGRKTRVRLDTAEKILRGLGKRLIIVDK